MITRIIIALVRGYQYVFSPERGVLVRFGVKRPSLTCAFTPSCSEYMIGALQKYGAMKGLWKGIRRIIRCTPWQKPTIDNP